ncbi:MAG: glycosyl hydrolase family 18 protein, partial [Kiritimatiellota bacterium]|nr:glycosyl hydrolase family 18 protein [Kiritimatiellota bacterium]
MGSYENGVVEFNDICDGAASGGTNKILNRTSSGEWTGTNGYTRYWDATAQAPFLFNGSCWITYDDDVSLAAKVGYAKAQECGGVMIWDLSCDTHDRTDMTSPDPYILINAIDTALRQVAPTLSISPANRSHSHSAISGVITVSANAAWTAESSQPDWLAVTSGSQGATNGTITYLVSENCGPARTGVISVNGGGLRRDYTVSQEAFIAEPLAADFDGDRLADPALYNTNGTWKIKFSMDGYAVVPLTGLLGGSEYDALAADFDGDGKADPTISNAELEIWVVKQSSLNYLAPTIVQNFGGVGWQAVAADFDGDAYADPALYNTNGTWKVKLSTAGYTTITKSDWLGYPGWQALAADFDGDAYADPAIYSASSGSW